MAEELGLQGLSGIEIIDDLLAQLRKRLLGDCNLRPSDNYSRGYSAKLTYSVRCFGLDQQTIDGDLDLGKALEEPADGGDDGELEIEQEEDIGEVRDRIANAKKEEAQGQLDSTDENETPEPTDAAGIRQKRKYTRKVQLTSPGIIGAAEEFKE